MMERHELEEHVGLFRRRAFALPAKHEVKGGSNVEWRLVRPHAPTWAIWLLGLLFVSGCVWAVMERHWTGLAVLVLGALGVGLMRRKGMRDHPAVEVIAKVADDCQTVTFSLAGSEWAKGDVRQMAIRSVFLKTTNYSGLSGPLDLDIASGCNKQGRLWTCVYVFGESEQELIFAQPTDVGYSGLEKAVRAFCEAVEIPLMEPDPKQHGPSVISI